MSINQKAFYLTKTMKGFVNFFNTRITSIEQYSNEPNTLYIYLSVNPTDDSYTDIQRVCTIVKYNLNNDKYTIKCEGKGAKKYNSKIKYDVQGIIDSLVKEANDYFIGDSSEALFMTQQYYHEQLKQLTNDVHILNQFHYDTSHTHTSVKEIHESYELIVAELLNDNESVFTEKQTTTYTVYNRSFSSRSEAIQFCKSSDFDEDLIVIEPSQNEYKHTLDLQYFSTSSWSGTRGKYIKHPSTHFNPKLSDIKVSYKVEYTNEEERDDINYTNINKVECLDLEDMIESLFKLKEQNRYNISVGYEVSNGENWIVEDYANHLDEYVLQSDQRKISNVRQENERIKRDLYDKELFEEFLQKYKAEELFKKFVEEKAQQKAV